MSSGISLRCISFQRLWSLVLFLLRVFSLCLLIQHPLMMESSKIFGGGYEEECQSSESGWTMYIGSPVHGDDYADNHDNDDDDDSDANHDDESDDDDSMASDASSGPNNLGRTHGNGSETGHGFGVALKHDHEDEEDHGDGKYSCFGNKAKEPVTKLQRKEEKKEEMVFMQGRKAKAPVHQSGAKKVIKNILMGKRK